MRKVPPRAGDPIVAAPEKNAKLEDTNETMLGSLKDLNKKAGTPSFAYVRGFYQLPGSEPAGAARIEDGRLFDAPYSSYQLDRLSSDPYEIVPIEERQAAVVKKAIKMVHEANIKLSVIEPSHATKLMEREQKALRDNEVLKLNGLVPASADFLVTVQKGFEGDQPFFVGRVIRVRDGGEVLALWKEPETVVYSMQPMLLGLVNEALQRLVDKKDRSSDNIIPSPQPRRGNMTRAPSAALRN